MLDLDKIPRTSGFGASTSKAAMKIDALSLKSR
jgi:hypothetical protein